MFFSILFCFTLFHFLANVNSVYFISFFSERELMFTFAICRRPSVCLSSIVRLSSVCRR